MDLGCGTGQTLLALRSRLGPEVELVGVDRRPVALLPDLEADPRVRSVEADLNWALPFNDGELAAAICHNTLECLPDKPGFLAEVARILMPGGHLLLGHTDFDTMVFNASDIELTRQLVHAFADTQEAWMDASDATMGRKLVAFGRSSPMTLVDTIAWVRVDTELADGGAAHTAVRGIFGAVRRDRRDELADQLDSWIDDLRALAARGEFLFSVNDYAVLLRKS